MHSVKLTLLIEDPADVDMEVRVVVPAAQAAPNVSALHLRPAVVRDGDTAQDDYVLGGYAGI